MCKQHVGINILARCFRFGPRSYKQSHVIAIEREEKVRDGTELGAESVISSKGTLALVSRFHRSSSRAIVFINTPSFPVFGLYPVTINVGLYMYIELLPESGLDKI